MYLLSYFVTSNIRGLKNNNNNNNNKKLILLIEMKQREKKNNAIKFSTKNESF